MNSDLVPVKDVLAGIFTRIEGASKNEIALPPRERRLPDESISRLRSAITHGWQEQEVRGPSKFGEYGYEPGDLHDVLYLPNGNLSEIERVAIVNEARRGASKSALAEHIAILAAHKKYTGSDGFTFVMSDIIGYLSHHSELAVRNTMDYFKREDDSPWFPAARDIIRQAEWEQKKIDNLAKSISA